MAVAPAAASEPEARARREGSRLAGLLVATGAFRSSQNMAQTTLSLLGRSLSLSGASIGGLSAMANVVATFTMLFVTSRFAEGRARVAVVAGSVLCALSLVVFADAQVVALVVASVLLGLGGGLANPALATAVAHESETARGEVARHRGRRPMSTARALAVFGLVLSASLTIGPLLESGVLSWSGERLSIAYLVFSPIAVVGAVAAGWRAQLTAKADTRPLRLWTGLRALATNSRWGLAMSAQVLYAAPFSVVVVFGGLVGREVFGLSASATVAAIAVFFLTSLVARAALALRPVTAGRMRVFFACGALTVLGLALLGWSPGTWSFFVAFALLGIPHGLTYPVALALVAESVDRSQLSQANAAFAAVTSLVNIVAPLSLGAVLDAFGGRVMLFGALAPVLACAVLLVHLHRSPPRSVPSNG